MCRITRWSDYPTNFPPRLEILDAEHNLLEQLPTLPVHLEELYVSSNRLQALPPLPRGLVILEAAANALAELPADLPRQLEVLVVSRNRLRNLPEDLPLNLALLGVQHNAIEELPACIANLQSCTIQLDGNPLSAGAVPVMPSAAVGRAFSFTAGRRDGRPRRTVAQVVRLWWTRPSVEAQARWDALDKALDGRADAGGIRLVPGPAACGGKLSRSRLFASKFRIG